MVELFDSKLNLNCTTLESRELDSSVSIVSGCWMDDQAIEFRSSAEARGFFP
jgi:hypothetical protein